MKRASIVLVCAGLLLACSQQEPKAPAPSAAPSEPTAAAGEVEAAHDAGVADQPAAATPKLDTLWVFREFDWSDSESTVYESVEYTDGFLCYRHKFFPHCAFVKTKIDGEELLAKFQFLGNRLTHALVLTPDLDSEQASQHLERVWKLLAAYTTRFQGEAQEQAAFPDWQAMAPGEQRVTHHWKLPNQEIRIVVGRQPGDTPLWLIALRVVDPQHAAEEPAFVATAVAPPAEPAPAQPSATASPTS